MVATKSKKSSKGRKPKKGLLLPHVRVLRALKRAKGTPLTRVQLAERAGFSPISGTINRALAGVQSNSPQAKSGAARPHKGLLDLGFVSTRHVIDQTAGVNEWVYELTAKGDKALESFDGTIGEVRSAKSCTNERYVKAHERQKAAKKRKRAKKDAAKTESNGHAQEAAATA